MLVTEVIEYVLLFHGQIQCIFLHVIQYLDSFFSRRFLPNSDNSIGDEDKHNDRGFDEDFKIRVFVLEESQNKRDDC